MSPIASPRLISIGSQNAELAVIPASNVKHLMLHPRVVEAVEAGRFHVHAVEHVDQGIELLTGLPAGAADADGNYPEGSVNRAVQVRLQAFNEVRRASL